MDQNNAIEVRDLKKKFKIYHDKGKMLKERAISVARNKYEEHWVLNGISFDVKKGEAVGLIGHNGCGKSTTLKLLTQIMYPTSGTVKIQGRVSSLLELGAGFHPDLSGRENIYINASIFGLTKKEIDRRVEDIIAFSELEEFIDNPVRTYSSGMYMRLAFSVAINVDADVLLIDEILAVGDVNFQAKCFNKLMEIKNAGTTIVLVSHSMDQIERICDRSIWVHEGLIRMEGASKVVNQEYLIYMGEVRRKVVEKELGRSNDEKMQSENVEDANEESENKEKPQSIIQREGTAEARFSTVRSFDNQKQEKYVFDLGEDISFELNYDVYKRVCGVVFGLSIFRNDGVRCYGTNMRVENLPDVDLQQNGKVIITFTNAQLLPGKYYVDVCIEKSIGNYVDYWSHINEFEIIADCKEIGVIRMEHIWSC